MFGIAGETIVNIKEDCVPFFFVLIFLLISSFLMASFISTIPVFSFGGAHENLTPRRSVQVLLVYRRLYEI